MLVKTLVFIMSVNQQAPLLGNNDVVIQIPQEPPQHQNKLKIYVSWTNLSFKVADPKNKKKTKIILNDLNGCAQPGQLIAIIGPSGSGKSSFLNCISGRVIDGVDGEVLFNNVPRPQNFARFTGYVIQDDLYFQSLTVRETLKFSANLKLPTTLSKKQRMQRVVDIIDELDLNKCADTIIGNIGAGISGGERRRLAIGLEILNRPSLLLLDEPTSGLDSASALMVGNILKKLTNTYNITILCTVHQPRYSLTTMFDKLYFLGDGNELYFGPSVPQCLDFFDNAGYKCPQYDNPADFLLDLVNTAHTTSQMESDEKSSESAVVDMRDEIISKLAYAYHESEYRKVALDYIVPNECDGNIVFQSITNAFYITPIYNQIFVVAHRSFIHKWREPIATMTQAFNAILMPLIFGSVYWQIDLTIQSSFDRISAIALVILMLAFLPFDVLMLFPVERAIFNREQAAGMYRPISFFLGRTVAELPQHVSFAWIMGTIAYWMYGLQNDIGHYLTFMIICVSMILCGGGLLFAFSAMSKNLEQSNLIATFFILLFMLFDGNWISLDKVPVYWRWIRYLSCLGYASNAAIVNEYRGLVFICTPQERANGDCTGDMTGEEVLYNRGLNDVDVAFNIYMIWVLTAAYRIVAFFCFWLFFRNQTPKQIIKNTFSCK
eukprot:460506_1